MGPPPSLAHPLAHSTSDSLPRHTPRTWHIIYRSYIWPCSWCFWYIAGVNRLPKSRYDGSDTPLAQYRQHGEKSELVLMPFSNYKGTLFSWMKNRKIKCVCFYPPKKPKNNLKSTQANTGTRRQTSSLTSVFLSFSSSSFLVH